MQNLTWNDLMKTGAIMDSTISIWTARTAMRAEDFDVTDSEELRKAVNLGIARLVPRKSMGEIRAAANEFQSIIDGAGVEFSAIRGSRFVQNEQIPRTVERANSAIQRFWVAVNLFCDLYQQIMDEQEPILRKGLLDLLKGNEAQVEKVMARIKAEYPSVEAVRRKFNIRLNVFRLAGFATDEANELAKEEAAAAREMLRGMMQQLRDEVREKVQVIMEVISRGGTLRSDTISNSRQIIEKVESLNVWGDRDLYLLTAALKRALDVAEASSGKVENGGILTELGRFQQGIERNIEQAVEAAAAKLTGGGRRLVRMAEEV